MYVLYQADFNTSSFASFGFLFPIGFMFQLVEVLSITFEFSVYLRKICNCNGL